MAWWAPVLKYGLPIVASYFGGRKARRPDSGLPTPTFTMPTERAYSLGVPETERIGQERLLQMLKGEYTPAQQRYFTEGMNPIIARLAGMGALGAGGGANLLARTGAGMVMGLQERALSDLLGLGARQRGYEQWGQEMGQRRYLGEADIAMKRWLGELERQAKKQETKASYWQTLGGLAGRLLPYLLAGRGKTATPSAGKILEEPTYMG
ncbi:MAG: hypothetical protein AB1567_11915 [bacterium]